MYNSGEIQIIDSFASLGDYTEAELSFVHLPSGKFLGIKKNSDLHKVNELWEIGLGCVFDLGGLVLNTPNLIAGKPECGLDVVKYLKEIKPHLQVQGDTEITILCVWSYEDYDINLDDVFLTFTARKDDVSSLPVLSVGRRDRRVRHLSVNCVNLHLKATTDFTSGDVVAETVFFEDINLDFSHNMSLSTSAELTDDQKLYFRYSGNLSCENFIYDGEPVKIKELPFYVHVSMANLMLPKVSFENDCIIHLDYMPFQYYSRRKSKEYYDTYDDLKFIDLSNVPTTAHLECTKYPSKMYSAINEFAIRSGTTQSWCRAFDPITQSLRPMIEMYKDGGGYYKIFRTTLSDCSALLPKFKGCKCKLITQLRLPTLSDVAFNYLVVYKPGLEQDQDIFKLILDKLLVSATEFNSVQELASIEQSFSFI